MKGSQERTVYFLLCRKYKCKTEASRDLVNRAINRALPGEPCLNDCFSSAEVNCGVIVNVGLLWQDHKMAAEVNAGSFGLDWTLIITISRPKCLMTLVNFQDNRKIIRRHCCCCSVAQLCPSLCYFKDCSTPGFPALHHLLELAQTHVHWVGDAIQPSHPLSPYLPALNLPHLQGNLSNDLALRIRWPKYWNFSFSISLSYEYSGLISFRSHWFDLLAVPGALKSLLQHHSSKASILWHSAFFMV